MNNTLQGEHSPEDLEQLFLFISGKPMPHLGAGIHTRPEGNERNKRIFSACLELEKQGRIERTINEPDHVYWMPVFSERKEAMKNLKAIEKRYAAGAPAKEDIGDLIAEVKRLQGDQPDDETEEGGELLSPADIRKMKRDELDALAAEHDIDLEGVNVDESKELLISQLCEEEEA